MGMTMSVRLLASCLLVLSVWIGQALAETPDATPRYRIQVSHPLRRKPVAGVTFGVYVYDRTGTVQRPGVGPRGDGVTVFELTGSGYECVHTRKGNYCGPVLGSGADRPLAGASLRSDNTGILDVTRLLQLFDVSSAAKLELTVFFHDKQVGEVKAADAMQPVPPIVSLATGTVIVDVAFIDSSGQRVSHPRELFPEVLHEFVESGMSWKEQVCLYDVTDRTADPQLLSSELSIENDGTLQLLVPPRRTYKLERVSSSESWGIVDPIFSVKDRDRELRVRLARKPYCLYGQVLNAHTLEPVGRSLRIYASGAGFFSYAPLAGGRGYAVCFTEPGPKALDLREASLSGSVYPNQSIDVSVTESLQRMDLRLKSAEER